MGVCSCAIDVSLSSILIFTDSIYMLVVQTRTHAQKYFQKLQKGTGGANHDGDDDFLDLVILADLKRKSCTPSSDKEKKSVSADQGLQVIMPKRTNQVGDATKDVSPAVSSKVITLSSLESKELSQKSWVKPHFSPFTTTTTPSPQFFYLNGHTPASYLNNQNVAQRNSHGSNPIKIIPPAPEFTLGKGNYPEPSPAACGKRKDMELAAAELLAGVASSMVKSQDLETSLQKRSHTLPPEKCTDTSEPWTKPKASSPNGLGTNLHIVNPEKFDLIHVPERNFSPTTPWENSLAELARLVYPFTLNEIWEALSLHDMIFCSLL